MWDDVEGPSPCEAIVGHGGEEEEEKKKKYGERGEKGRVLRQKKALGRVGIYAAPVAAHNCISQG
jgi:hypothetical protein